MIGGCKRGKLSKYVDYSYVNRRKILLSKKRPPLIIQLRSKSDLRDQKARYPEGRYSSRLFLVKPRDVLLHALLPKCQSILSTLILQTGVRLPEGASAALAKPTKYHYYPHNQHIYLLPECAVQQVCNAVYVRLNFTQPLCACPGRYRDPCSASLDSDDLHTTELVTDPRTKVSEDSRRSPSPSARGGRSESFLIPLFIRRSKSLFLY